MITLEDFIPMVFPKGPHTPFALVSAGAIEPLGVVFGGRRIGVLAITGRVTGGLQRPWWWKEEFIWFSESEGTMVFWMWSDWGRWGVFYNKNGTRWCLADKTFWRYKVRPPLVVLCRFWFNKKMRKCQGGWRTRSPMSVLQRRTMRRELRRSDFWWLLSGDYLDGGLCFLVFPGM